VKPARLVDFLSQFVDREEAEVGTLINKKVVALEDPLGILVGFESV
jgi:hypothetical protein